MAESICEICTKEIEGEKTVVAIQGGIGWAHPDCADKAEAEEIEPINIDATIDLQKVIDAIKASKEIKDDQKVFEKLAEVEQVRSTLLNAVRQFDKVYAKVKQELNDRAKSIYGDQWKVIKSDKFRINRKRSGSVYALADPDNPPKGFTKVEVKLDTDKIDDYIEKKEALPQGIEYNPNRGESILITVEDD